MYRNPRVYGNPPYSISVIHGGPGAPGQVAPIATELSKDFGVLEPFQTKPSITNQIHELKDIIEISGTKPNILIGHSYGAVLSYLVASKYPDFVERLILVASPPFEAKFATKIMDIRINRLKPDEKNEFYSVLSAINQKSFNLSIIEKFSQLITKIDSFNPITLDTGTIKIEFDINRKISTEFEELRSSGKLIELGKQITCPVFVIHGTYDPHPIEGILKPFMNVVAISDKKILTNCGHYPWLEVEAKAKFFKILKQFISQ